MRSSNYPPFPPSQEGRIHGKEVLGALTILPSLHLRKGALMRKKYEGLYLSSLPYISGREDYWGGSMRISNYPPFPPSQEGRLVRRKYEELYLSSLSTISGREVSGEEV